MTILLKTILWKFNKSVMFLAEWQLMYLSAFAEVNLWQNRWKMTAAQGENNVENS